MKAEAQPGSGDLSILENLAAMSGALARSPTNSKCDDAGLLLAEGLQQDMLDMSFDALANHLAALEGEAQSLSLDAVGKGNLPKPVHEPRW